MNHSDAAPMRHAAPPRNEPDYVQPFLRAGHVCCNCPGDHLGAPSAKLIQGKEIRDTWGRYSHANVAPSFWYWICRHDACDFLIEAHRLKKEVKR